MVQKKEFFKALKHIKSWSFKNSIHLITDDKNKVSGFLAENEINNTSLSVW